MLLLAIDTTSEHGGVAVFRDLECLASIPNTEKTGYSITLFEAVDRAVAEAAAHSFPGLRLQDIELFAAATGPGSFTGIRTGLAATQGWAMGLNRPVVGISVLEAMANEARPNSEWAAAIMDARRGEYYVGLFRCSARGDGLAVQSELEGMLLKPEELEPSLEKRIGMTAPGSELTCIIRQHDSGAQALRSKLGGQFNWQTVPDYLLGTIARLAFEAHRLGQAQSPAGLNAYYIRRPDAEVTGATRQSET